MASERDETPPPWTAKRRAALVLSLLKGETSTSRTVSGRPFDAPARCPGCSGVLVHHRQVPTCVA